MSSKPPDDNPENLPMMELLMLHIRIYEVDDRISTEKNFYVEIKHVRKL